MKTLIEVVMENLGIEEGEEFDLIYEEGFTDNYSPYYFEDNDLYNRWDGNENYEDLHKIITGELTIKKLH